MKVLTVLKLGSDLLDCPSIVYNAEESFWLRVRSEVKGFGTAEDCASTGGSELVLLSQCLKCISFSFP